MPSWIPFVLCCLCASAASSQAPAKDGKGAVSPPPTPGTERSFRGSCSEAASRDVFTACDADGDDRLDVFEASDALETVRGARDWVGFGRLDKDRDGYVTWPEFDAALRTTLQRGGTFRVRTVRPLAPPTPEPKPATPVQKFLQLHDTDQNGGLDPAEIDRFVRERGLPGLGSQLRSLDTDHSGRLEEAELAPWFARMPGMAPAAGGTAGGTGLMPPWRDADRDRSGAIDANELAAVLRHLDPALATWARELLRALDRNGDGVLQPAELPGHGAANDGSTALAPGPRQLPVRVPLR